MQSNLLLKLTSLIAPRHYFALLGSLLGLTLLAPVVEHYVWAKIIVGGMLITSLLTAALAVKNAGRISIFAVILASLAAITWIFALCDHVYPFNTISFQITTYAITLSFFVIASLIVLQNVFRGTVDANKICGAVCVYLLTGICFAMIHMMIALSDPEAYRNNVSPTNATTGNATPNQITNSPMSWATRYPLFVYFSFCTFSTVGYGDILPISRLARSVSCLEATIGQYIYSHINSSISWTAYGYCFSALQNRNTIDERRKRISSF